MVFNFLAVFMAGVVVALFVVSRLHAGTIIVDWTDPEKDIYRINMFDLGLLEKRKYILLNVDRRVDPSQK